MIANPTPRYYTIYRVLKQAIENREFAPDAPLPGENGLARKFGVSRLTIRRSLDLLQQEGLVDRRHGSGTYPRLQNARLQPLAADINQLLAKLEDMGANTQVRVLEFGYEAPGPDVQHRLELGPRALVQKAVRVRHYEGAPFSYLVTYVPEAFGRHYDGRDLVSQPLQSLLRKAGVVLESAEQSITATLADAPQAEALGVGVGSPLLCIKRVIRNDENVPVEYLLAAYNPERFEYRMTMSKAGQESGDAWIMDPQSSRHAGRGEP